MRYHVGMGKMALQWCRLIGAVVMVGGLCAADSWNVHAQSAVKAKASSPRRSHRPKTREQAQPVQPKNSEHTTPSDATSMSDGGKSNAAPNASSPAVQKSQTNPAVSAQATPEAKGQTQDRKVPPPPKQSGHQPVSPVAPSTPPAAEPKRYQGEGEGDRSGGGGGGGGGGSGWNRGELG